MNINEVTVNFTKDIKVLEVIDVPEKINGILKDMKVVPDFFAKWDTLYCVHWHRENICSVSCFFIIEGEPYLPFPYQIDILNASAYVSSLVHDDGNWLPEELENG